MISLVSSLMPTEPSYRAAIPFQAVSVVGGITSMGIFCVIPKASSKAKIILSIFVSTLGFLSASLWNAAGKQAEENKSLASDTFNHSAFATGILKKVIKNSGESITKAGDQVCKKLRRKAISSLCKTIIAQIKKEYFPD